MRVNDDKGWAVECGADRMSICSVVLIAWGVGALMGCGADRMGSCS